MSQTVVAIFKNLPEAQKAFNGLLAKGFERNQVDLSEDYSEKYDTKHTDSDADDDDSISSFFDSLFGDDHDAKKHRKAAHHGSIITVHAKSKERAEIARDILDGFGAVDVDNEVAQYGTATSEGDESVNVIKEDLQVGKREVETGGVRVRSRIIERPVEEHLRLRTEHVHVERNPVDRKATDAELENFKDGTIEMTEHAEEAVVSKEARVTEEIHLKKDVEEKDETIRENVRETEVDVDKTNTDKKPKETRK